MWSKEGEETKSSGAESKVFQIWGGRAQKVGVPTNETKEERRRSSTTT